MSKSSPTVVGLRPFTCLAIGAFATAITAWAPAARAASATWTGASNNNWQAGAGETNWSTGAATFPGATSGTAGTDIATFDTTGSGSIALGGYINVRDLVFTSGSSTFTIGGATDTLYFTGSLNNATGGVFLSSGAASQNIGVSGTTLTVANTNTNFNNNSSGATLTIAGNIGHTAGSNTNLFFGADGTGTGTGGAINMTGAINSSSSTITILKNGLNTATLSGTISTNGGSMFVRGGTLNVNNAATLGAGALTVSDSSGSGAVNSILNISANISAANFVSVQNNGRSGAVYQTAGTVTFSQAAATTNFQLGTVGATLGSNTGAAYYKISGGSLTANEFGIGSATSGSVGVMDVTGGTVTSNGYLAIGRGTGTSSGLLNITGGTVNSGAVAATGPIDLNWSGTTGAISVLNVGGGPGAAALTGGSGTTATSTFAGRGLNLASANVAGTQGIANLLTNGTLTVTDVVSSNANPVAHLNFNGGTLKATATNLGASFITNTANIDAINVYSGGGTVDNSGTNITIAHSIVAPAGQGISASSISVPSGGSGYVGAPLVRLTGGSGSGATGYAVVSGGVVTSIVITSPGIGYLSGETLTATFTGGVGAGGTAATTITGIAVTANSSGGMTFAGSGTTTLSGANTYTGATTVSSGKLALTGTLASTAYQISNGAIFDLSSKSSYSLSGINLTIGSNGTTAGFLDGGTVAMTLGGNLVINFTGALAGSTFDLMNFGSHTGDFATISLSGTVSGSLALTSTDTWTGSFGGNSYSFNQNDGILTVTAVPEPHEYALAVSGLLLAAVMLRRRRLAA